MILSRFTSPNLISAGLRGMDAAAVVNELTQRLAAEGVVTDSLAFCEATLNREFLAATNASSVAFPHARSPVVSRLAMAVGRSASTIAWGSNGSRVSLVFLIAVPPGCSVEYLGLMSALTRFCRHPELSREIHAARETEAIFEILSVGCREGPRIDLACAS
jgi:fructose PTS system EIIBC or EIIC component